MNKTRPKLCIISPYSYPLFNPACTAVFGGSEVRVSLIAKELAKRGSFDVCMLVWNYGQPHTECRDGVTLYSWLGKAAPLTQPAESARGIPRRGIARKFFAFLEARIPWKMFLVLQTLYFSCRDAFKKLFYGVLDILAILRYGAGIIGTHVVTRQDIAAFMEIDADLYMMPGLNDITAHLAFFCSQNNRRYILLAGSDIDFDPAIKAPNAEDLYGNSGTLKLYSIEKAHLRIVQNQQQAQMLSHVFGQSCIVMHNPMDIYPLFPRSQNPASILWVGKSDTSIKQPGIILELAKYLPEYEFTIILSKCDEDMHEHCIKTGGGLSNVKMFTYVPFSEIEKYYADAKLFINTSVFEGFPNTFLQAAKYGVPIISLKVDPGQMLSKYSCGMTCSNSFNELVHNTRRLMNDASLYGTISKNCLTYLQNHHDKDIIIPQLEKQLLALIAG